jgi:hypothetical protein
MEKKLFQQNKFFYVISDKIHLLGILSRTSEKKSRKRLAFDLNSSINYLITNTFDQIATHSTERGRRNQNHPKLHQNFQKFILNLILQKLRFLLLFMIQFSLLLLLSPSLIYIEHK